MCGIVGYVGGREACPILLKGLHRLEYRGYDSAGVAMVDEDGALNVYKCKGKVSDLEHFLAGKELGGNIGIAHTRWATHGVPNDVNAHPHCSESENIALIHNGIIENYRVLKDALEENGYTFRSSTDSEVLVNLIEYIRYDQRLFAARSRAAGAPSGGRRLCYRRGREEQPRRDHRGAPEQPHGHRHRSEASTFSVPTPRRSSSIRRISST